MKISCEGCGLDLGEIREGSLRKNIVFLCKNCNTKRVALELQKKNERKPDIMEMFDGIFK